MPIYPNTIEGTEVTRTMTQLLAFIATLGCFLHLSLGWCPSHNVEDMVTFSDIVLVGTVTEIIPDPSPSAYPETYGAKIDVRCAYKGRLEPRRVPETITIGGAGHFTDDVCLCSDLDLNKEYVLFLLHSSSIGGYPEHLDIYVQQYAAQPLTMLDELLIVCDLELFYPALRHNKEECPRPAEYDDDCIKRPDY